MCSLFIRNAIAGLAAAALVNGMSAYTEPTIGGAASAIIDSHSSGPGTADATTHASALSSLPNSHGQVDDSVRRRGAPTAQQLPWCQAVMDCYVRECDYPYDWYKCRACDSIQC